MTKEEIIEFIDDIETITVASGFSIVGIVDGPGRKVIMDSFFPAGNTTAHFGRKKDNSSRVYQVEEIFEKFDKKNKNNEHFLTIPLMANVILIHDLIKENGFAKTTPEFEFLRHLRNAFGHGNRFTLNNNEPRRPASFKSFTIDRSLNGMENVLINYIKPGDVYDLITYIKNNI